jgi:hypothetical protein
MIRSSFNATKHQALAGALLIAACSNPTVATAATPSRTPAPVPAQTVSQSGFYCNLKAMSPAECQRHKELTDYLIRVRKQIVETPKGYEFQFSPDDVSLTKLVEWVTAEEKCCPFFNFHIDLEREGQLVCLGLGGADGIKTFIRSEFQIPKT